MKLVNNLIIKQLILPLVCSIILTIIFLSPMLNKLESHLYSDQDGLFIVWTIDQVSQRLITGENIYNLPILYNFANTLTFSDPYFSTAVFTIFLKIFTNNLILINNLHLILGTIMVFISMWLLTDFLFQSKTSAFLSALTFTFSGMHLGYLIHLHTYLIAGIPLSVLFFLKYLQKKQLRFIYFFTITFLYQVLNAPMTGFFLCFIIFFLGVNQEIRQKTLYQLKKIVSFVLLIGLISVIFYLPYFQSASELKSNRTIRDAAHFAVSFDQLVTPEIALAVVILLILNHQQTKKGKLLVTDLSLWLMVIFGLLMMLGPVLKIDNHTFKLLNLPIPLPYALFYYLLPGFKAFRATSRFIVLVNFGLSLLLGMKLAKSNLLVTSKVLLILAWGCFLLFSQKDKYPLIEIETQMPEIYQLASTFVGQKMVELPAYTWDIQPLVFQESLRLFYQTKHHLTLFNGTSGFVPTKREQDFYFLTTNFPNQESIIYLSNLGVRLVMIHFSQYDELKNNYPGFEKLNNSGQLKQKIEEQLNLSLISCQQDDCLYLIKP